MQANVRAILRGKSVRRRLHDDRWNCNSGLQQSQIRREVSEAILLTLVAGIKRTL